MEIVLHLVLKDPHVIGDYDASLVQLVFYRFQIVQVLSLLRI
jgi:hypothetical protein